MAAVLFVLALLFMVFIVGMGLACLFFCGDAEEKKKEQERVDRQIRVATEVGRILREEREEKSRKSCDGLYVLMKKAGVK